MRFRRCQVGAERGPAGRAIVLAAVAGGPIATRSAAKVARMARSAADLDARPAPVVTGAGENIVMTMKPIFFAAALALAACGQAAEPTAEPTVEPTVVDPHAPVVPNADPVTAEFLIGTWGGNGDCQVGAVVVGQGDDPPAILAGEGGK